MRQVIYDINNWRRLGRGQVLQFFATDDEVQNWLLTLLPPEYGPYTLVGADSIEVENKMYVEKGFEIDISDFKTAIYEKEYPRWQYWIRSKALTPKLDFLRQKRITWVLSYSGLVGLQHGRYLKDAGRDFSSIGIVDKVINDETGEEIVNKEYLSIFKKLKKEIKRHLLYSSIWKFDDGSEREDIKLQLMTQGVVDQYNKGILFKNKPGRRVK
ncbi:MAG: hypothetical protein WCZ89_10185 [Phycisphaerae bacterium]